MVFLIVFVMFALFILASYIVDKKKRVSASTSFVEKNQTVEQGLYLHPSHSFVKIQNGAVAQVGYDEFTKKAFGNIHVNHLAAENQQIKQGDVLWQLQIGERTIRQRAPLSGTVVKINSDSNKKDWLLEMKPENIKEEIVNLIQGDAIALWLKNARISIFKFTKS